MAAGYGAPAPAVNDRYKQFDVLRQRAKSEGNIQKQQSGEALKRRFAALGNLNSGAYVKAAGLQDRDIEKQTNQAVQDVDMQEIQEKARQQDITDERAFTAGEAEKGRIFNRELFDKDQAFKQAVFTDESKRAWADLNESIKANKINALQAIGSLEDDALEAISGQSVSGGFLGIGRSGQADAMKAILKKYGYA